MTRTRLAQILLLLAATAAAASGTVVLLGLGGTDETARVAEVWRGWGLLFFAGIFGVLAHAPHGRVPLWLLVIGHKAVLTVSMAWLAVVDGRSDALGSAVSDGALSVLLVVAFLLTRARPGQAVDDPVAPALAGAPAGARTGAPTGGPR